MSKLLSAIAQSEAQRQPRSPSLSRARTSGSVVTEPPVRRWGLPLLSFLLPVAGMLVYTGYTQGWLAGGVPQLAADVSSPMTQATEPAPALSAPDDTVAGAMLEGAGSRTYPAGIERLPYPEFYTEPLPRLSLAADESYRYAPSASSQADADSPYVDPYAEALPADDTLSQAEPAADSWDLDGLDYSDVSPELAAHLRSAIAATRGDETSAGYAQKMVVDEVAPAPVKTEPEPIAIGDLPASVQKRIPTLNFQTHIYASTANSRWVKVNGREAYEGDEIAPGVVLRRIEPRQVVFDFDAYLVAMPALSEW